MASDEQREMTVPQVLDEPDSGFVPDTPESYPVAKQYQAHLPTGAKFLLQRPNILALLQRGDIPNPLIGVVQKAFMEGELADKAVELAARATEAGRTPEAQLEYERDEGLVSEEEQADMAALVKETLSDDIASDDALGYIDVLVYGSVVLPKLTFAAPVETGGKVAPDGKLSIHAIDDSDKMFIFTWATSQLDGLATFRREGAGADRVGGGGEVRDDAEQPAGDAEQPGVDVGAPLPR